jgi:hypothetical protein
MHLRSFDLTQLNFAAKLQIKSVGSGIWGNKNNMERLFVLNTNGHKLYMKSQIGIRRIGDFNGVN